MFQKILVGILLLSALVQSKAQAQDTTHHIRCDFEAIALETKYVDSPRHGATAALTAPASFPAAAIDTCGKFQIFYADLEIFLATGIRGGFADATYGATRRNTICSVLSYIQSRIDFSKIPPNEYVRLYIDTSCSTPFPAATSLGSFMLANLAIAYPFLPPIVTGATINGFAHDFITSGTDPNLGDYHAYLKMNFEKAYYSTSGFPEPLPWNNGLSAPNCDQYDLFSVALHYVTHSLGWFSWSDSYHTTISSLGVYSNFDLSLYKTPWMHSNPNPFAGIVKVYPTSPTFTADYWLNNKLPPDNYPVSGGHLLTSYYESRVSPGERQNFVMAGTFPQGGMKRAYQKGEWEGLHHSIGYDYNSSFATDSTVVINNHIPYSQKMGADTMNKLFYFFFIQNMPEYIPADYQLKNDVGASISINLNSLSDLKDADGDPLSVYPNSLVNFRGCGIGGNNHKRITLSNSDKTITYTPRANFYGKAQFGFNLYDGKEKGGFVVFTINVTKGNNVSVATGANLLLNGDFEEGSEVKTNDTNLNVPNSVFTREELSQHMSDSHPYDYSNAHYGTALRNAVRVCTTTPSRVYEFGHDWCTLDFIAPYFGGSYSALNPYLGLGNRYQPIATHPINFYLGDTLKKCQRYILEFDAIRTLSSDPSILPYPAFDSIIIGFGADTFFSPSLTPSPIVSMKPYPTDQNKRGVWTHFTIPFTYCRATTANIMSLFIKGLNGFAPPQIVDNVVLRATEDPISFKLKDTAIGRCSRRIYSDLYDLGCSSFSYEWRKLGDPTIIATTATLDISNPVQASYTLKISDGCSSNSDTIAIAPCPCSVGAVFGATIDSILPSTTSTSLSSGIYHLTADLTITGTPTFSNALILIEPDVQITVVNNAKLSLDNCHLLTCPDTNKLWKGITLATGGSNSGKIVVNNNSLIEDAETAINAISPSTTAGDIIVIDSSIFNRNLRSIHIEDYKLTGDTVYPFSILNTVFTSRDFKVSGSGYPSAWTEVKTLKSYAPHGAVAPYLIDRDFSKVRAKNDQPIEVGIDLKSVGNVSAGIYSEIQIGGSSDSTKANLFDNLSTGIYAASSNLASYNNVFINMYPLDGVIKPGPSTGPYYRGAGIFSNGGISSQNRLVAKRFATINDATVNKFFDCNLGIYSSENYETILEYNRISSSQTYSRVLGSYGIYYNGSVQPVKTISIFKNNISNTYNGIVVRCDRSEVSANIGIDNNTLAALNPWIPTGVSTAGQYMQQGIRLESSRIVPVSPIDPVNRIAYVRSNSLSDVYFGISVNNMQLIKAKIENNTPIILREQASAKAQYGISMTNCYKGFIKNNYVTADIAGPVPSNEKIRAYYVAQSALTSLCGNNESNIGRGYDFAQIAAQPIRWLSNNMDNNRKAFVLGSDIGWQVNDESLSSLWHSLGVKYPSVNTWAGTWSGGSNRQTFVEFSKDATKSILYTRVGYSNENPSNHGSFPLGYDYSSSSILPLSTDIVPLCDKWFETHTPSSSLFVAILGDKMGYGSEGKSQQWIDQMGMYRLAMYEPEILDSSAEFKRFVDSSVGSRYQWIAEVETALANEDTSTAQSLLASVPSALGLVQIDSDIVLTDYSDANYIIDTHIVFYNAYLHYLKQSMSLGDSNNIAAIAQLCPALHGPIVYQARAFFDYLMGKTTFYDDDSCTLYGNSEYYKVAQTQSEQNNLEQQYSLFPNPNNGIFVLKQSIAENKSVNLNVYNAIGALVLKQEAVFVKGQTHIDMKQQAQGVYLLCIGDAQQRATCLRFIIK